MASYESVRASSPTEVRDVDSDGRIGNEGPGEDAEQSDAEDDSGDQHQGLLANEAGGDIEKAVDMPGRPGPQRGKRSWLLRLLTVGVISALVLFDVWLVLRPDVKATAPAAATTSPSPGLPEFLKMPLRRPDEDYILDSNWDFAAPNQVRYYNWTILDKEGNPDGVYKPMMTINGQFPGPLIEANEGDTIVVDVHNAAVNATSIHWHGIFQNGTAWMDGTAGVTQCPIAPGRSFQYNFTVKGQAGTCELPLRRYDVLDA
jgi:hypothetical protein